MNTQSIIAFGVFCFALGACVGSFLNVVIWRLPHRGREVIFQHKHGPLTLSWPPSHCPVCDAPIRWYQNIPMVSWLFLRARCANCRTAIPVRYPLVELGTAVLFTGLYLAYFVGQWQPAFDNPLAWTQGPAFALHLMLIAALLAASAIDIDRYEIPLEIPWFLMVLGIVGCTLVNHRVTADWSLNTGAAWWMAKPVAGAAVGLIAANVLLRLKILPQSFSWEFQEQERIERQKAAAKAGRGKKRKEEPEKPEAIAPPPKLTRFGPSAVATAVLVLGSAACWLLLSAKGASFVTLSAGIIIFMIGVLPRDPGQEDMTDEVMEEISTRFARREVLKEVPFLLVPLAFAVGAYFMPFDLPKNVWLGRLLGSLLGMLVGGGIVWVVRIGGTLLFNKVAMGTGDAHLMAGVGAVIGAPLVIVAFFTAPFIAIAWAIVRSLMGRPNVLPYGPWLSVASILSLLLGNPLLAWYLSFLFPAVI